MEKILILGIGNYLMRDEGVGIHFIKMMGDDSLPDYLDILDGGTGGVYLSNYMETYTRVILIDATLDALPTGTIRLIIPKFSKDYPSTMSTYDTGMKGLIETMALRGTLPKIYLFAVSIDTLQQPQVNLSAEIKMILPNLKTQVLSLAKNLIQE